MTRSRIATVVITAMAAVSAAGLAAQSAGGKPAWETLVQAPLPPDSEPFISINSLSVPAEPVPEHAHQRPVFAYVVQGEIENHIEPDPPAIHKAGGFFYEPPMHVHKMLRGLSAAEPAKLIIMGAGRTGVPESLIKPLEDEPTQLLRYHFGEPAQPLRYQFRAPLQSTVNQELGLFRLTLPAGSRADARAHAGPGLVFVLEGQIEMSGATHRPRTYSAGDLFREPANRAGIAFRNMSSSQPAKLLLYQVSEHGGQGASDWPQFRGPSRDGVATAFSTPRTWPEQLTRKWKIDVGEGYATPILVRDRLYVFTRQGDNEVMQAIEAATGKSIWQTSYAAPVTVRRAAQPHGPGPKSTPAFADGRLFTLGMGGMVTAFDAASGRQLWQRPADPVLPLWNTAMSPLVERELVIVHVGGHNQGALTAFDVKTGAVKWTWGGDGPSYASPVVADLNGVRQIITLSQAYVVSVSATDGQLLWRRPFSTDYDQNVIMPIVIGDRVLIAGHQKPTSAFRVVRLGNQWTTENIWENTEISQFMTNGVMVGDTLFGLSERNRGEYFLLDTKSGATVWTSMPRQAENAAIVRAGDFMISLEDDAELMVGRISGTQFQELKRYTVADAATWTAPVFSENRIFVKDVSTLALWTVE